MAESTTSGARPAYAYLAVTGLVILASEALPTPRLVQDLVYSLVGLSVAIAIMIGVRRYQPRARTAWQLMAAGQVLWVIADTSFNWQQDVMHVDAFPTVSDLFYLLGYPTFAVGLLLVVRGRRQEGRDYGPLLDSLTVTVGLTLLSWVMLARPTIESLHNSASAAAVGAAYPAMDILLVGALIRLISSPGGRSPAFRLLMTALALLITADTLSDAFDLFATNTVAGVEYLWLFSYAAWGAAALHPSMTRLSDPTVNVELRFRGMRLLAFFFATLISPAILAVHEVAGVPIDVWAVIIGSVAMSVLVVVRMNLAIGQIATAHRALEHLQDELAVQATHDSLTGLVNRTQSARLVAGALGRARRSGNTVGLLFIDLDAFKAVNDTHGHRAGDDVLHEVAARMTRVIRDGDFVGRLGGDEFVVGMENVTDENAAVALANRLIVAVSATIRLSDGTAVQVGASIGIALGRGGETNVETLLHEADLAVYEAKEAGRGCVKVFSGGARAALKERNDLERAIAEAIANDELTLHYQPIIEVASGAVACYETLVRWNRPGVGLVRPDDFLPLAETSDLICHVDTWVLHAALDQLARWNTQRGDRTLQLSVNISGRHISQHRVLMDIGNALRLNDVDPGQLVIEVTETAVMDGSLTAANLEALRHAGVIISLDDFGSGYQSSSQLSRLPVDILKIDREFVNANTASSRSLLELMVKAAHAFDVKVVAEGVERKAQLDLARELGCEYVQGFYLGEPLPAGELIGSDHGRALAG
jgi:diguanylate cyclase (GGDEF)-like protein